MKNPETIHIVFGASAAGGLKHAFKDQQTEEIIELPDYFADLLHRNIIIPQKVSNNVINGLKKTISGIQSMQSGTNLK